MRAVELRGTAASALAVALFVAALAYVDARGAVGPPAAAVAEQESTRSPQATAVEAAIGRTNLTGRLEKALGPDFGGAWFDPATARLRVGVASDAGTRIASAVAAEAGLPGAVATTKVGSSWAELDAAQARWDRRLTDLLARGEVSTSLSPERNAVEILLGSAVPAERRAALEAEAAAEDVAVGIEVVPYSDLGGTFTARCKPFAEGAAFCDPTLVGGVTIDGPVAEAGRPSCTAGVPVITKDRSSAWKATVTYLLTAGHCFSELGETWYAYNKEGEPKGENRIGDVVTYIESKTDVGLIEIEQPYWAKASDFIPVVPTIAPWDKAEPEPFAVSEAKAPAMNTKSCISGQHAGIDCGEIIKTNQTVNIGGKVFENLIEVKEVALIKGDSGGPFFAESNFKEATPKGVVEGIAVAVKGETGNPVFQSLATSFAELKNEKGWDLELLTKSNEERHPFKFVAEATPTVLTGTQHTGAGAAVFALDGRNLSCTGVSYTGEMTVAKTIEISLVPLYGGCTLGAAPATVDINGCQYKFTPAAKEGSNFEGEMDIVCAAGKKIEVTSTGCTITIPPQFGLKALTYTNSGAGATRQITIDFNLIAIAYEEHKIAPTFSCPSSTVPTANGTLGGSVPITGENASKTHRGIWVE